MASRFTTVSDALNPGQQIRAARKRLGWSQAELARRLGSTQSYVSELEAWIPGRTPTLEWFLRHAEVWAEMGLGPELVVSFYTPEAKRWLGRKPARR